LVRVFLSWALRPVVTIEYVRAASRVLGELRQYSIGSGSFTVADPSARPQTG
jgi:hypothetical protein